MREFIVLAILLGAAVSPPLAYTRAQEYGRWPSWQSQQSGTNKTTSVKSRKPPLSFQYKSYQYGFCFSLPETWKGYTTTLDQWEGSSQGPNGESTVARGPIISLRHPEWTAVDPRQDIPIMVFTRAQWRALENGDFWVSAAPIGPSELGRNSKYVFALPPRFEYAFPTGVEEVLEIVKNRPLRAPCK